MPAESNVAVFRTARAAAPVLTLIRVVGYLVGTVALAAGLGYAIVVATGAPVWVSGAVGGERGFVQLPLSLSLIYAGAFLLGALTVAGIAFIVGDLAWRVRRGVQFVPAVSRSVWALAVVLAVGSWLTRIAQTIAEQSGLVYPDNVDPSAVHPLDLPIGWTVVPQSFLPDGPLLGLALVLALLAYIVQSGERLQRDTEGLV